MKPASLLKDRALIVVALAFGFLAGCKGDQTTQTTHSAPSVLHLSFGINSFDIGLGGQMTLPPIKVVSASGDTVAAPASLAVVSRNSDVVRIDSGNVVRSIGMGSTWIVASVDTAGQSLRDSLNVSVDCTMELVPMWTPSAKTFAVGESFTPSIVLYGCGGHLTYPDTFQWSASDSTVIRVDASTGTTTGLHAGSARVFAHGARFSSVGSIGVTVTAP
jgi:hypothetical protein